MSPMFFFFGKVYMSPMLTVSKLHQSPAELLITEIDLFFETKKFKDLDQFFILRQI